MWKRSKLLYLKKIKMWTFLIPLLAFVTKCPHVKCPQFTRKQIYIFASSNKCGQERFSVAGIWLKQFLSKLNRTIINNQRIYKKEHGIEQNQAQKEFMISNLHKNAYLKRSASL